MENRNTLTKKEFLRVAGPAVVWIAAATILAYGADKGGAVEKSSSIKCAECPMRARYDRDPKALLSRLWKWHTSWCPGWKSYLASLQPDERKKIVERYR